jgi:hypothetical protein
VVAVPWAQMPSDRNRDREKRGDHPLAEIANDQDGLASLEQLREIGVTQRAAAYRAQQGRLHRVHRGVYSVGHRSYGRLGALRAAVLACGEGAVLSHGSAAALWGLRDQWPVLVDVTVPCQRGRKVDGVRCRRCRYPGPAEVTQSGGVPCTTPARTKVDLAGMLGVASLRRVVERAAVLKILDLAALDAALRAAKGRRGVVALEAIAAEWHGEDGSVPNVLSDFEALVLPRLLAMGLPRPLCNQRLRAEDNILMVDFFWKQGNLVVETDGGATHETPVAFQRDRWRDQLLVAAGYSVMRVTWAQMKHERPKVIARISRALGGTRP